MSIQLNHIIIPAKDKWASARFLANILGVMAGPEWGPFVSVTVDNGVTLDYAEAEHMGADPNAIQPQHCAFLVGDAEFDGALGRLRQSDVGIYAGPGHAQAGEINHLYGGRGVYFDDPDGHILELITAPYGEHPRTVTR